MIRPQRLKKGDTIGLLAASSPVAEGKVRLAAEAVRRLGFKVVVGESCISKYGFLAGTDDLRAKDINQMFADKDINGIFNIRGGYGSQRLLDMLDYDLIKTNVKVFAGYSDTTALHIVFNQLCGFITYHSPMPSTELCKEGLDDYTRYWFNKSLFDNTPLGKVQNPRDEQIIILNGGRAEGNITGGNLSMMVASIGTPYEIDTDGKIIFIEEIGEEPYRIDRMLLQMKYAGKFRNCVGIVLGAFTDCKPEFPDRSLTLIQVFQEILPGNKPAIYNFRCGHCLPTATIPLGARVSLNVDSKEVTFLN